MNNEDLTQQTIVIIVCLFVFSVLWIWYGVKSGRFETPRQVKKRKYKEAQEFAAMSPEVQQLHLHAKNKVSEFKASFVILIVTCIFSGGLIYWAMK